MRILHPSSPDTGYEPGFVDLNLEEGSLDITHPSSCILMEDSKTVPETLSLRCVLRPLPLVNKTSTVQLISEGEVLEKALLYEEETVIQGYERDIKNSQWKGIAVEYAGVGQGMHHGEKFFFSGKSMPAGQIEDTNPLYVKLFCGEGASYQVRITTLAAGNVLTSPPGVVNTRVLRGYGGYYHPGVPLEQIEQVYYALTSEYDKTRIRLYTSSTLEVQHTPPPHGGRDFNHTVMFSPLPRVEEYMSLTSALSAGHARLSLKTELGVTPYTSYFCEPVPGHPTFVTVCFRP